MTKTKMREVFERYYTFLTEEAESPHRDNKIYPCELPMHMYAREVIPQFELLCHLAWMCRRCLDHLIEHENQKAHVWLGYIQGELRAARFFTITQMRDTNREPKVEVGLYGTVPRRFRIRIANGTKHPTRETAKWFYGCYFPQTDLIIGEGGVRGTGVPTEKTIPGLEWLDPPANEV